MADAFESEGILTKNTVSFAAERKADEKGADRVDVRFRSGSAFFHSGTFPHRRRGGW